MNKHVDVKQLIDALEQLQKLREAILDSGDVAIEGTWIHEYSLSRTYPSGQTHVYQYAKWQSQQPIFKRNPKTRTPPAKPGKNTDYTCHQHIGRTWSSSGLGASSEAIEAYQEYENRLRTEAIDEGFKSIAVTIKAIETKLAEIDRNRRFGYDDT